KAGGSVRSCGNGCLGDRRYLSLRMMNPIQTLRKHRINAIFTIDDARHAVQTARALAEAGIKSVEVTMRTPAALESIEKIAAEVPEVTVGAGTVLTPENVRNVKAAGGKFCIAP